MMNKDAIGNRLEIARKLRRGGKLEREQVAKRLKITVAAVQHHENGRNLPDAFTIAEYARMYDVSTDWIIMGRGRGPTDLPDPYAELIRVWDELSERDREHVLDLARTFIKRKTA